MIFTIAIQCILLPIPADGIPDRKPARDMRGPDPELTGNRNETESGSYKKTIVRWVATVYRRYMSPAMSRGCPCHPSCSEYMVQAVIRYPVPVGIILGLDRLLHEAGEIKRGRWIETPSGPLIHDPLENHIFWWDDDCD